MTIAAAGCPVITLDPTTLRAGVTTTRYSQSITASGGTAPYTYTVSNGALPTGLTLNSATGSITGVPVQPGLFTFTIRATDAAACIGAREYTVTIVAAVAAIPALDPLALVLMILVLAVAGLFAMRLMT